MSHEQPVDEFLNESAALISDYLRTLFSACNRPQQLFAAMNYSLLAGGKRIRPALCLAAANTFCVATERVLPAAAALELVHTYSLIHDDLPSMDDDDLRRGRPTNHIVYGDATALLAGDGLLTYAFELLATPLAIPAHRQLELVYVLARAAGVYGMVGGQQADLEAERSRGELSDLEFIHTHKTAQLIQAAVVMGGLFADLTAVEREALAEYGLQLGLTFQIVDDWLDVAGDPEQMGKAVGSDARLQKLTYPRLLGLDETRVLAEATFARGLEALDQAGLDAPLLRGIGRFVVYRNR